MSKRTAVGGCLLALALTASAIIPVAAYRGHVDSHGRESRDAIILRIEATDPPWRWEDIDADTPTVPDAENAAQVLSELNRVIGSGARFTPIRPRGGVVIDDSRPPNRLLDDEAYELIERATAGLDDARPLLVQ